MILEQDGNGPIKRAASENKYGFRFEIIHVNYQDIHVLIAYMVLWILLTASKATESSKQPWRSHMTSISYVTKVYHCCILLVNKIFPGGKMTQTSTSFPYD